MIDLTFDRVTFYWLRQRNRCRSLVLRDPVIYELASIDDDCFLIIYMKKRKKEIHKIAREKRNRRRDSLLFLNSILKLFRHHY